MALRHSIVNVVAIIAIVGTAIFALYTYLQQIGIIKKKDHNNP